MRRTDIGLFSSSCILQAGPFERQFIILERIILVSLRFTNLFLTWPECFLENLRGSTIAQYYLDPSRQPLLFRQKGRLTMLLRNSFNQSASCDCVWVR